jgi:acyl-CoA reductase-like NAD-dependent aldehyde dehydrogenase
VTSPQQRRSILWKAAILLRERKEEFVEAWQEEMDVHEGFVEFNVMTSAGMIEEVASNITTALQGDIPQAADRESEGRVLSSIPGRHTDENAQAMMLSPW